MPTSKHTGGSQTYGGHPNIQGVFKYVGMSNHTEGCPKIGGTQTYRGIQIYGECKHMGYVQTYRWASKHMKVSKHMGTSKHTGVSKHMRVFKHKVAFKHTGGASKHMAASKHRGGIPTYRWYPSIWWHLNLWGHMDTPLVWQNMLSLCCLCTEGIQTLSKYMGASKHWSCPNIQRAFKHREHSNIQGHPNICGHPIVWGHMDTPLVWCFLCVVYVQGTSKHMGAHHFFV